MAVTSTLLKSSDEQYSALPLMGQMCKNGYGYDMIKNDDLMRPLMKFFNKLSQMIENHPKSEEIEFAMIKVLCLVSQLINDNPKFRFPFNKKFVANIFLIDAELVEASSRRKEILRVISVIFLALTKRIKLLKEFGMLRRLKIIVLENYSLVEEIQTIRRFNSAIKNIGAELPVTIAEAIKYRLVNTMSRFIGGDNKNVALAHWMTLMASGQQMHLEQEVPQRQAPEDVVKVEEDMIPE